jgi:hypothetical protein
MSSNNWDLWLAVLAGLIVILAGGAIKAIAGSPWTNPSDPMRVWNEIKEYVQALADQSIDNNNAED